MMGSEDWVALPFSIFNNNQQHFVVVLQDSISDWLKTAMPLCWSYYPFL